MKEAILIQRLISVFETLAILYVRSVNLKGGGGRTCNFLKFLFEAVALLSVSRNSCTFLETREKQSGRGSEELTIELANELTIKLAEELTI
jgi:hypothetical protein